MGSSVNIPTISSDDPSVVEKAVKVLGNSGLIIYPTETCYGLGADATNASAVKKMSAYKSKQEGKPISIAVSDRKMAEKYAEINDTAANLYDNFLPGPITVVSRGTGSAAPGVESEYGTIGIRIPNHPLILKVIDSFGKPITATSANVAYQPRPYSIESLLSNLPQKNQKLIDLIIDAGELPEREVSTIVDTTLNTENILRSGGVKFPKKGNLVMSAVTESPEETRDFGSMAMLNHIDALQDQAVLFALGGDLGTGKTQFTKGMAKQLGISHTVRSPTFTLSQEYPFTLGDVRGLFVHIDAWRLGDENELQALSIEKYLSKGNVIVVEWADKYFDSLSKLANTRNALLRIGRFNRVSEDVRKITIEQT